MDHPTSTLLICTIGGVAIGAAGSWVLGKQRCACHKNRKSKKQNGDDPGNGEGTGARLGGGMWRERVGMGCAAVAVPLLLLTASYFQGWLEGSSGRNGLMENLRNGVYVRIGRSDVHGVGVIAVRRISRGTNPFAMANSGPCSDDNVGSAFVSEDEIESLPQGVGDIIRSFYGGWRCKRGRAGCRGIPDNTWAYGVSLKGPNSLDVSYYMNHARKAPNMAPSKAPNCRWVHFAAARDIEAGEELLLDHTSLGPLRFEELPE